MTIEEEVIELKAQNLIKFNKIEELHRYIKKLEANLKAKQAELEGATIMPKGWDIHGFNEAKGGYHCVLIERSLSINNKQITAFGISHISALRNAIKQIEELKGE